MHPYFHPTSVVLVDDDADFLQSFSFRFQDNFLCEPFSDPNAALAYVAQRESKRQHFQRFFTSTESTPDDMDLSTSDQIVGFRSSQISKIISDADRFSQVSVMIVDYEMPSMTGLDFCQKLQHLPLRKILLTGKVGRETAVDAFNQSLIDGFLEKQAPDLSTALLTQVRRQQEAYFASTTGMIGSLHSIGSGAYMGDPVFRLMFEQLVQEKRVVEYYSVVSPNGILLGIEDGSHLFLRILDDNEIHAQYEIAALQEAPPELLMKFQEQSDIPCFPTPDGYYHSNIKADWRNHIFPAHILHGNNTWRYSLIKAERLPTQFLSNAVSYFEYRNSIKH